MIRKYLVTALTLAAFSMPALAASEFYVVKNDATKKCEVTDQKPDGKTMMDVGKKTFASKDEASAAMATIADCK